MATALPRHGRALRPAVEGEDGGRPRRKEAGREGEGGGASAAGAALRGREGARPAPAWEEKGGGGGRARLAMGGEYKREKK